MKDRPKLHLPVAYDIGYAKPPTSTRFKTGHSGNPKGRPKGKKRKPPTLGEERLKSVILEEAYRGVKIRENDRMITVPMANAVIRALAMNAAKGNNRSAALFTQIVKVVEDENKNLHDQWIDTALNYKLAWEKEIARRKEFGLALPELYPHPDYIRISPRGDTIQIDGPMTKEHATAVANAKQRLRECKTAIADYESDLLNEQDPNMRKVIEREIGFERNIEDIINRHMPDWAK